MEKEIKIVNSYSRTKLALTFLVILFLCLYFFFNIFEDFSHDIDYTMFTDENFFKNNENTPQIVNATILHSETLMPINTARDGLESVVMSLEGNLLGKLQIPLKIIHNGYEKSVSMNNSTGDGPNDTFMQASLDFQKCSYEGKIDGFNTSYAVFTICKKIFGIIRFENGDVFEVFSETQPEGEENTKSPHRIQFMGSIEKKEMSKIANSIEKAKRLKRRQNGGKQATITIALGIDNDMYRKESQDFENRVIRFINGFNLYFESTGRVKGPFDMRTLFTKTYIYSQNPMSSLQQAEPYLYDWCEKMGPSKIGADVSILMKSGQLPAQNGARILGLSFGGTICSSMACSVIMTSSDIMGTGVSLGSLRVAVHELIHLIGAMDDSIGNGCTRTHLMGMADTPVASSCTKEELSTFMSQKQNIECLIKDLAPIDPTIDYEQPAGSKNRFAKPSESQFNVQMQGHGLRELESAPKIFEFDMDKMMGSAVKMTKNQIS